MILEHSTLIDTESNGVAFVVPGKPISWHRPAQGRSGARYDEQVVQKQEVAWICKRALQGHTGRLTGPVVMRATFYFPRPKTGPRRDANKYPYPDTKYAGDIDNAIKLILDSINGVAYDDDGQVISVIARKLYAKKRDEARTVVHLMEID